ncbi:helix-turn-helix domain-containing protein [Ornithinibacillus halotolerans]|uniref:Transcriptional regulator n=1 Tax=Ornithinibacillus halotolerans TaxID=1274357 RepID=A0A916RUK6_9BACI|nr:helix-turn-helix transcriptional regulator [Ornithinibacillus halotolerans]GGA71077.1 transcriptional regulator [Ornithinibacillus halotolerans]
MDTDRLGRRIKAYRKLKGYTQVMFAKELNISLNILGEIERGTRKITEENIKKISDTLNIDKNEILGVEDK